VSETAARPEALTGLVAAFTGDHLGSEVREVILAQVYRDYLHKMTV
jgi:hypothetical protein